jgi:hypothetical protein
MTVSGVHTFTLNRDEIITEALELTGTVNIGDAIPSEVMESCGRTLNLYAKSWQAKGLQLHTYQSAILPLVTGQQSYLLGPDGTATEIDGITVIPRPLKITDVRFYNGTAEIPISKISLAEYNGLNDKAIVSQPSQYAYDPQLDNSRLYIWPVSDNSTDKLYFKYEKPVDDFTTSEDTATMPVDWLHCFCLGLAYAIAPKRMIPLDEQVALKARYEEALWDMDDFEETSIFFSPSKGR